jgi:hypothetical protein
VASIIAGWAREAVEDAVFRRGRGPSFASRETHHGAAPAAGDDGYCGNNRPRTEKPRRAAGAERRARRITTLRFQGWNQGFII